MCDIFFHSLLGCCPQREDEVEKEGKEEREEEEGEGGAVVTMAEILRHLLSESNTLWLQVVCSCCDSLSEDTLSVPHCCV